MNSKFRGTMLGVLIGDCCGATFEGEVLDAARKLQLKNFLKKRETDGSSTVRLTYTDDTAMTKSVGKCLLTYDAGAYQKDLAVNFVKEYFFAPKRGYGAGVTDLFQKLRKSKFEDILGPASYQFGGQGSFGNGAAMRISPVALYCLNKPEDFLIDLVTKTSVVTHCNAIGVNGAILQALAVHQNLKMDPSMGIDVNKYLDELLEKFRKIEKGEDEFQIPEEKHYTKQLDSMRKLLNKNFPPSDDEVVNLLGHSVNALYSVPTALYCFLRCAQTANPDQSTFRETLEYTISLGGDTDTIASMAGALAGAFYSDKIISENLMKHCEDSEAVIQLADQLYEAASK